MGILPGRTPPSGVPETASRCPVHEIAAAWSDPSRPGPAGNRIILLVSFVAESQMRTALSREIVTTRSPLGVKNTLPIASV